MRMSPANASASTRWSVPRDLGDVDAVGRLEADVAGGVVRRLDVEVVRAVRVADARARAVGVEVDARRDTFAAASFRASTIEPASVDSEASALVQTMSTFRSPVVSVR